MTEWRVQSPVAIGGLGGSGTRAVAEILQRWGFYLGADLNPEMDNLWFTLIFKRPSCVRDVMRLNSRAIAAQYRLFASAVQGRRPGLRQWPLLLRVTVETATRGHNHRGDGRGIWAFQRAFRILRADVPSSKRYTGWGWKEPNTHVYLRLLAVHDPSLRYIHVMRNGFDMAFSKNDQQVRLWGAVYDLNIRPGAEPTPTEKLDFWIRANQRAVATGAWMGAARFFLLRFDDLCNDPDTVLAALADFLGASQANFAAARTSVRPPLSLGRYKHEDLSAFRADQIEAVRQLGFDVEAPVHTKVAAVGMTENPVYSACERIDENRCPADCL